ncbi:MAG: cell filamentation protein Fic [Gemmatimonadetes bacterium]|nr:cell filamentation protein Fic [Gemmatimonadota bacterium]
MENTLPEAGDLAGYSALMARYDLQVPRPPKLAAISRRYRPLSTPEWRMFASSHAPGTSLQAQLEFALKWEGVNLGVLSALFKTLDRTKIERIVRDKPTGGYARRVWFLYEWLTNTRLDLADAGKVTAVPVLDPARQFALEVGHLSRRHRVRDNLPGTREFCPLVWRTQALEHQIEMNLREKALRVIGRAHPDIVRRAAAFLLLADSKASFGIEGERPSQDRAMRWGQAIGEAGVRGLEVDELEELQEIVIGDARFVALGLRSEGGWIGKRDRTTRDPVPEHISARAVDLPGLMRGITEYATRALGSSMDPVVVAAALSFGFVYIHPFLDGNGRIHRWIIHHVLARAGYNPSVLTFPVSAAMLRGTERYREVLSTHSSQLLPFVRWRPTERGNVEVLNETVDLYRFFDATRHAEYLYRCVEETVTRDLPHEVRYLEQHDEFSRSVQRQVADMPEDTVELLAAFLRQNSGTLSRRARRREFKLLTAAEIERVEALYSSCFSDLESAPA